MFFGCALFKAQSTVSKGQNRLNQPNTVMRTEQRMDKDYEYHVNTGELPEYSGGGDKDPIIPTLITIVLFVGLCIWGCVGSCSSTGKEEEQKEEDNQAVPASQYYPPMTAPQVHDVHQEQEPPTEDDAAMPQQASPRQEEIAKPQQASPQSKVQSPKFEAGLSAAYEEGYDQGYDDGEDDAVSHSGWQHSFDDDNNYRGQKKKDFEIGYLEGYEAGYDDNAEGDE